MVPSPASDDGIAVEGVPRTAQLPSGGRARGLSPEERLVLALGRLHPGPADIAAAADAASGERFSWTQATSLAAGQKVELLVARSAERLADAGAIAIPADAREHLRHARLRADARATIRRAALGPVLADFHAAGIPVLLLKGAALEATVFPPGARSLGSDVDLLIHAAHGRRAFATFEQHGFHPAPVGRWTVPQQLRYIAQLELRKTVAGEPVAADVHLRLVPQAHRVFRFSTARLFERGRPAEYGRPPARVLAMAPEDILVHMATQLVNDLLSHRTLAVKLGRVADLDALARSPLDWRAVAEAAIRSGAAAALRVALGLARLLGAAPPAPVLRRLEAASPGCGLAADLLADPRIVFREPAGAVHDVLATLLFGRLRTRLAYVLTYALPRRAQGRAFDLHLKRRATAAERTERPPAARIAEIARSARFAARLVALAAARAAGWSRLGEGFAEGLWRET